MSFPTITVTYFLETAPGSSKWQLQALPKPVATVESSTAGTITTPVSRGGTERIVASVYATADLWLTVGETPADPSVSGGARLPVPASTVIQLYLEPSDKLRWSAA